jgi:hypothetical protein
LRSQLPLEHGTDFLDDIAATVHGEGSACVVSERRVSQIT